MRKRFIIISLLSVLLFSGAFSSSVLAGGLAEAFGPGENKALDLVASKMGYSTDRNKATPENVVALVIQTLLSILGVVFVIIVIYGGIMWMTAGGNEEKIDKAKDMIRRATVGLIIVISAYAISVFVVNVFIDQVPGV